MNAAIPTIAPVDSRVRRLAPSGLAAFVLLAAAFSLQGVWRADSQERLLRSAAWALLCDDAAEAERTARQALEEAPHSARALLIAGRAAVTLQRPEDALAYYRRVPDDGGAEAALAQLDMAKRLILEGEAAGAERRLRRVLEIDPDNAEAQERLVYLLEAEGRTWEALPLVESLIRRGDFVGEHLLMAGSVESQFLNDPQFVERCRAAAPEDPLPLMVQARVWRSRNDNERAREVFAEIAARHPEHVEAQSELGQLLVEAGAASAEFIDWHGRLPAAAEEHPGIWFVRGIGARQSGQLRPAARCFWEALRRHPNHPGATYQLSQTLIALGEKRRAEPFSERSKMLGRMELLLVEGKSSEAAIRELCDVLEKLGRVWEAAGWRHAMLRHNPGASWAVQALANLHPALSRKPQFTLASANLARQIDLSDWPLPQFGQQPPSLAEEHADSAVGAASFSDQAGEAGIQFNYYNGADPQKRRAYMFEYSGGGVAVLDFDGDGWSDIYLTQGCAWPPADDQRQYLDRLYRNLGDGRFEDVTARAGLGDQRLSQGATVGDFNNDGFPDLYLGNIGPDRLYQNNGDGTFRDVTEQSGIRAEQWTSSCVMADFNGDASPDIFIAAYLAGPEVFDRACTDHGKPTQCGPVMFPAEDDRLYLSLGDGRFEDVSAEAGILAPDGKGLGVVAGDFDGSRRLSLFVSNDTTANFFFANQTAARGARPSFIENGIVSGLGLDEAGKAQACMGIAAGDANADGLLDLFVTNFFRESNTLYVQQPDRTFVDGTRSAELRDPSYAMLGWGTQFIDAELDGAPDLVLLNGHINDFSDTGVPYQMPAQYFRNRGGGRFAELPAHSLGPYFGEQRLGRALARLDWNRDGLEDLGATHVDAPFALLTNQTAPHGRYLSVQLRGVKSDRDAIGATVQITVAGKRHVRQLTAGDGFQASNERKLVFGLGQADRVEELTVSWPSGLDQTFHDLEADQEMLCVEGRASPFHLPRH